MIFLAYYKNKKIFVNYNVPFMTTQVAHIMKIKVNAGNFVVGILGLETYNAYVDKRDLLT